MKKIDFTHISAIFSSLRVMRSQGQNPDLAWRVLLGVAAIFVLLLGLFAVFAYDWASNEEAPVLPSAGHNATVSVEDIRTVVDFYKIKQAHYQELLSHQPEAPLLGKTGDAKITPVDSSLSNEPLNVESSVTAPVPRGR